MKCLAYFSIICLLEFTRLSHGSNCSIGWREYKNYCYFFHNVTEGLQGQNWADAHLSCQRYTGNLLSIADSEEDAFVQGQLKNDGNQYWIGLNDIQNNGTYEWSDNESLLFSKSKAGSLGNQENMDCVEITLDIWSNNFCNLLLGFICKIKIGSLSSWSYWGPCSASCKSLVNGPYQYRNRSCVDLFSFDSNYIGCFNSSLNDQQLCNQNVPCPGFYSDWSAWGTCSESCQSNVNNPPSQFHSRTCLNFTLNGGCYGASSESQTCNARVSCAGDLTQWSAFSACSQSCQISSVVPTMSRYRSCLNPTFLGNCYSQPLTDFQTCNAMVSCPGQLTEWGQWSQCPATCQQTFGQFNLQYRSRQCVNTSYSGNCGGQLLNNETSCVLNVPCPGILSQWTSYSACSESCVSNPLAIPSLTRTRTCTTATLGVNCDGIALIENLSCNGNVGCPGFYSGWSSWSTCSESCNSNYYNLPSQFHSRTCLNFTLNGGCKGPSSDYRICNAEIACPGHLTQWSAFSVCSQSCQISAVVPTKSRLRSCFNNTFSGNCFLQPLTDVQPCNVGVLCPGFCLEQTVGDEYSGLYTFPNTPVNQLVTKSCVYNTSMMSSTQCVWNYVIGIPEWKPDVFSILDFCPFKSGTSKQLQEIIVLEREPVTKENVVNVIDELNSIISNGSLTLISEISRVSNVLQNVININSSSNLVTNSILLIVDNLISMNRDLIKQANQVSNLSAVFLSQLDDLAKQQTSNTTITMKNFGFTAYTSLVNEKPIYIYSWETENSSGVNISSDDTRYKNAKDYIILPSQLFNERSKIKVHSYIFWDKAFFEKKNETIDSAILSATISDDSMPYIGMVNSINPIKMKFSSNTSMFGYRTCRFYIVGENVWSTKGCNTTSNFSKEVLCQCNHLTNFALILDVDQSGNNPLALRIMTWIGCGISIAGLFFTILTYTLFRKLRVTVPSQILLNLSISLMMTLIIFLALVERIRPRILCKTVASLLQFFILLTFSWMLVEGINLYQMFVKVFRGAHKSRVFMVKAYAFAWGIPLIFTLSTSIIKPGNMGPRTDRDPMICVVRGISFYYGILLPVCLMILANIVILVLVLRGIGTNSKIANKSKIKKNVRIALGCSLLLGTTWIFAILAVDNLRDVFQWLFCIFNSLQGFFIFLFYVVRNSDVKNQWHLFLGKKNLTKSLSRYASRSKSYDVYGASLRSSTTTI